MNKMKQWIKCAGIRAIKTVAQTAIATIGTSVVISEVNWVMVGSTSLLAGILSLLTSVAGLAELKKEEKWMEDYIEVVCDTPEVYEENEQ